MFKRVFAIGSICALSLVLVAGSYSYTKETQSRDLILEKAHLYDRMHWRCDSNNAYGTSISNAECPYGTTSGEQTTLPYCWGGDDDIYQFLEKMTDGKGAGDKDTSSSSPYSSGNVGSVDCSGYVSQLWNSSRYSTASFYIVSYDVGWSDLAPGDAINKAGSHIRLCENYPNSDGTISVYESTGTGWQIQHRDLSYDSDYAGIRYDYISARPTITSIQCTGNQEVTVQWYGDVGDADDSSDYGFTVEYSLNGIDWKTANAYSYDFSESTWVTTTGLIDSDTYSASVRGLEPHTLYYFRLKAKKKEYSTGSTVYEISNTCPARIPDVNEGYQAVQPPVLLVDGFDRYMRMDPASHDFLTKYGIALDEYGVDFDYVDNVMITLEKMDSKLNDYQSLLWMMGTESSNNRSFNHIEMDKLMTYLDQGGNLFVSGAEIGYDMVYKEPDIDNMYRLDSTDPLDFSDFYNDYLKASYVSDGTVGNGYGATGVSSSIFNGVSISFDNGTHGTYDPYYPDKLGTSGGSSSCLTYSAGGTAATAYDGTFKVVNMGFPFETIYPQTSANTVMSKVLSFFGAPAQPNVSTISYVRKEGSGQARIAWENGGCDKTAVYSSTDGSNWNLLQEVNAPSNDYVFTLTEDQMTWLKIVSYSGSTASIDSDVYLLKIDSNAPKVLLVDGLDRWNSYDSQENHSLMEIYASAVHAAGFAFDAASNDAITRGDISLESYDSVIWILSEESTNQEAFSFFEQDLVASYLDNGGFLFVSGEEIGWDLDYKGTALDQAFYHNYLKVTYDSDDADTTSAQGASGSFLSVMGTFSFGRTNGPFTSNYPDVITKDANAQTIMNYAGSDIAAIQYTGTYKLVYMGFSFDSIINEADRNLAMERILTFFHTQTGIKNWTIY